MAEDSSIDRSDSLFSSLGSVIDEHANEHTLGPLRANSQWQQHKIMNDDLLREDPARALGILSRLVDSLNLYAPALKGLQDVHKYVLDALEELAFRASSRFSAVLLGHVLAMNPLTSEAVTVTIENMLLGGASDLVMCLILGVKRAGLVQFDCYLPTLLRQIQRTAFTGNCTDISQDALKQSMQLYHPGEAKSKWILQATHALFAESLQQPDVYGWTCFIICNTPMLLRNDLRKYHVETCDARDILDTLLQRPEAGLCQALPILTTWETSRLCADGSVDRIIRFMITLPPEESFDGLGQIASVVLEKFGRHLPEVSSLTLRALQGEDESLWPISQRLLGSLLAALGPITLDMLIIYLRQCPSYLLLRDVHLLDLMASLLPNLRTRIIQVLVEAINEAMARGGDATVLAALTVFPLQDPYLAQRAQEFVLWSLNESREQAQVLLALQLATDTCIATPAKMRALTYKAAQLLLSDVHMALSALSNPVLASTLDERSCQMILLALYQSLEPSIQIVAAKLLTHLSTGHRAIVQPLAWSHIRQSLSLMDFLQTIDPTRAIVEACIISNLLPALPPSVHEKYTRPVKTLILLGLENTHDSNILSLIFSGLANLARLGSWKTIQQTQLAMDLLDLQQEVPKDSQHAALSAIARLLAAPQHRQDLYEMLLTVHSTFRRNPTLDSDLKAQVASIYGHLGTIERNPVISRDSKAAIDRENANHDKVRAQVAEARERSGAGVHLRWLVSKALSGAKSSEDVLEAMTSLGILRPGTVASLIPNLPALIIQEIHGALDRKVGARTMVIFLCASLHSSPEWLQQHWSETADLMSRSISEGEVLSVLKGMEIALQACR